VIPEGWRILFVDASRSLLARLVSGESECHVIRNLLRKHSHIRVHRAIRSDAGI
jgi:hypothetical protein